MAIQYRFYALQAMSWLPIYGQNEKLEQIAIRTRYCLSRLLLAAAVARINGTQKLVHRKGRASLQQAGGRPSLLVCDPPTPGERGTGAHGLSSGAAGRRADGSRGGSRRQRPAGALIMLPTKRTAQHAARPTPPPATPPPWKPLQLRGHWAPERPV